MSFSFGFSGDDYASADEVEGQEEQRPSENALAPAQEHQLAQLIHAFPRTIAYSVLSLGGRRIPRRELWDIKHQLMSGDATMDDDAAEQTMAYMAKDDVIHGLYEGGFKTWECSLDLAVHLPETLPASAVELGCGTALPSLYLLDRAMETRHAMRLMVQDYNLPVLQLATLPNLFLVWLNRHEPALFQDDEGEVSADATILALFQQALADMSIDIACLSGAWSPAMLEMLQPYATLVLASETIYAPSALPSFLHMLEALLRHGGEARIAAKHIYFGVGGGILAFGEACREHGLRCEAVYEQSEGIRRSVLRVWVES